ncbi:hypothetical protein, partial [Streptomyces sp. SYSU K217416]
APDSAGREALLDFAAARVLADPGARLTEALEVLRDARRPSQLRPLGLALEQWGKGADGWVRRVLSLPATVRLTRHDVASALWATARAVQVVRGKNPGERVAMGRRVLHPKATETWTPWRPIQGSREEELWALVAGALVAGVDVSDTDQLAAYHLKEIGASAVPQPASGTGTGVHIVAPGSGPEGGPSWDPAGQAPASRGDVAMGDVPEDVPMEDDVPMAGVELDAVARAAGLHQGTGAASAETR